MKKTVPPCYECESRSDSAFCILNIPELQQLNERKTFNLYRKGQTVYCEGSSPQGIFCIYSGKVKIHKEGNEGQEQIVRFARRGSIMGYKALLNNENHKETATTLEDSLICYFPKEVFMDLILNQPGFSIQSFQLLTLELNDAQQTLITMTQNNARARVGNALLRLERYYGTEEDGITLNVRLSRNDISNITGTTPETVIRILSDFNRKGIIILKGKRIAIPDKSELKRIADTVPEDIQQPVPDHNG